MRFLLLLTVLCCLSACKPDAPQQQSAEETLRAYQAHIDNNRYQEAMTLSTPAEQQRLAAEARLMQLEPDSSLLNTAFLSIACTENQDTAYCACQLKDEYGTYNALYRLLKNQQTWLVDTPPDTNDGPLQ
jgi:outer membrane biogenesis lipoprotein LolB